VHADGLPHQVEALTAALQLIASDCVSECMLMASLIRWPQLAAQIALLMATECMLMASLIRWPQLAAQIALLMATECMLMASLIR
jgi:hypothetical protein